MAERERIQKVLANLGYMSRRKAETFVAEGRIMINGVVAKLGDQCDPSTDTIVIDGETLDLSRPRITTILFNKPKHVVTTKSDPQGRPTVMEYLPREYQSLNPVGRLDFESEGLIVLTNDGDLHHRLTHPSFGVKKLYIIRTARALSPAEQSRLEKGIELDDGVGRFVRIEPIPEPRVYEITVEEGRNRFIRRMISALGTEVERLRRLEVGPYQLGDLRSGEWRVV